MENFEHLKLNPKLHKALAEMKFEKPTPIQAGTFPVLLGPRTDFIGLAATGTGKTVAFALPLLQRLRSDVKGVQALILCPTRELCLQVSKQVHLLGQFMGAKAVAIYGGASYSDQIRGLKSGASIVVGTPGRTIDHIESGTLDLSNVHIVILDEADEMISMGFKEDMETILKSVNPGESNRWLFSATMSPSIRKVTEQFLKSPKMIQVNKVEMLSTTVEQIYYYTHESNKPEVLCKLIDIADEFYGVIFCQTKSLVVDLTKYLSGRGYRVDCLHGDMSQSAREVAIQSFRDKKVKILICTDVASRGLDIKEITHVVNYSLPRELDNYVHRIGRTARGGKDGVAFSLVTPEHRHLIGKIERLTKSRMKEGVIPSRKDVGTKKISQMLTQFQEQPNYERAIDLMDESWKTAIASMSSEEVAARFLSMLFPWVFSQAKQDQMIRSPRVSREDERGSGGGDSRRSNSRDRFARSNEDRRGSASRRADGQSGGGSRDFSGSRPNRDGGGRSRPKFKSNRK